LSQYDQLVRLQEWELDQKRRMLAAVEAEVQALVDRRRTLEEDLRREQGIAANSVEASLHYGTFANQIMARREALDKEILAKEEAVKETNNILVEAYQELRKAEIVRDKHNDEERRKAARLEQLEFDEIGRNLHLRRSVKPG